MSTSPLDSEAGLRLKAWLESGPPRPIDIARRAGVSRQFIADILAGRAKPSSRVVSACAELGIPVRALGLLREDGTPVAE